MDGLTFVDESICIPHLRLSTGMKKDRHHWFECFQLPRKISSPLAAQEVIGNYQTDRSFAHHFQCIFSSGCLKNMEAFRCQNFIEQTKLGRIVFNAEDNRSADNERRRMTGLHSHLSCQSRELLSSTVPCPPSFA